jgi:hypothetical protein
VIATTQIIAASVQVVSANAHVIVARDPIISSTRTVSAVVHQIMSPSDRINLARAHIGVVLRHVRCTAMQPTSRGQSSRRSGEYDDLSTR